MLRLAPAALALSLVPAAASAQVIWTVDDNGPADFVSVQDAIDAAADGDTILVRTGNYGTLVVDGKGLTIQGEPGAVLSVFLFAAPIIVIRNIAADQAVHLRGFETSALGVAEQETTVIDACDGPVLLEDISYPGSIGGSGEPVEISDCASVTLVRCSLIAPATFASYSLFTFFSHVPYRGLIATDSNVFLYDTVVRGSSGISAAVDFAITIPPGTSGAGVVLRDSTLLASGCTFTGGSGGGDPSGLCYAGEDGQAGLELLALPAGPGSTARLIDCTINGGSGGNGGCGLADGVDAPDQQVDALSQVIDLPGSARSFSSVSPAQDGTVLTLSLTGDPGDEVLLHVSEGAVPGLFLAPFNIALHMSLPVGVLALGTVPPGGTLNVPLPIPSLPGLDYFRFVGQALFLSGTGFHDGGPSTLLVLGGAL
ncbi:MAG: hypothetical protein AAF682_21015 [Planctomycetota bacterium]